VAALVPKAELDGEMGDSFMGVHARLMSQAMRKLTGIVSKSSTCLIFINQIREKIGVMFGNPETTTGGRALKFYASVRVDIRRISAIKEGETVTGNRTKVKIVKNKLAPPFREAEFDIIYGEGISKEGDLVDLGAAQNVIEKSGAWYSYKGERIGQGRENAKQFLKANPDIAARIEAAIRQNAGLIADQILADPEGGEDDEAAGDGAAAASLLSCHVPARGRRSRSRRVAPSPRRGEGRGEARSEASPRSLCSLTLPSGEMSFSSFAFIRDSRALTRG
jgi:recombination protein RecA